MTQPGVPEDLRRFIFATVPSVPFVEALLVYRTSCKPVSLDELAGRLYIDRGQAAEIVRQLCDARLVQPDSANAGHHYAPAPELSPVVDLLATFYRTHLVEVTSLIHSRTGKMAQHFADAFRIRKE